MLTLPLGNIILTPPATSGIKLSTSKHIKGCSGQPICVYHFLTHCHTPGSHQESLWEGEICVCVKHYVSHFFGPKTFDPKTLPGWVSVYSVYPVDSML